MQAAGWPVLAACMHAAAGSGVQGSIQGSIQGSGVQGSIQGSGVQGSVHVFHQTLPHLKNQQKIRGTEFGATLSSGLRTAKRRRTAKKIIK